MAPHADIARDLLGRLRAPERAWLDDRLRKHGRIAGLVEAFEQAVGERERARAELAGRVDAGEGWTEARLAVIERAGARLEVLFEALAGATEPLPPTIEAALPELAAADPRPATRRAAIAALVAAAARSRRPEAIAAVQSIAFDPGQSPYVRRRALGLVRALPPELAESWLARVLDGPLTAGDDPSRPAGDVPLSAAVSAGARDGFLVRAEAVRLLGERLPAVLAARAPDLAADPSELVRATAVDALGASLPDSESSLAAFLDDREPRIRMRAGSVAARRGAPDLCAVLLADDPAVAAFVARERFDVVRAGVPLSPGERAAARARLASDEPRLARAVAELLAADRTASSPHRAMAATLASLSSGERRVVPLPEGLDALGLAALLVPYAVDGHGFWLAPRSGRRVAVTRGDRLVPTLWRALHEVRSPQPAKRQGVSHTLGRADLGPIRVPPGGLAEQAATGVPGQRVEIGPLGSWAPESPLVDDVLHALRRGAVTIVTAAGEVRVERPARLAQRLWAHIRLRLGFSAWEQVRTAALQRLEPRAWVGALERLGVHVLGGSTALAIVDITAFLAQPELTTPAHVGLVIVGLLVLLFARMTWMRARIRRFRRAIPVVIGGWGTRGKSGTERLKAALFEGLGVPLLSKTTGCEAMVLHGPPGGRARELFLFRPYDKATIWEQAHVLQIASGLGARVVLWECMALNPLYVDILQRWWMRDDLSTITNAYPDHEDVQGPTGLDVATVIGGFGTPAGPTLTTEANMFPLLADVVRAGGGELRSVPRRHQLLIPQDLMDRMPHLEHRSNVALAAAVAAELGVDPVEAIALMADHVVPDLGALSMFEVEGPGRREVRFVNGSSANDPLSFRHNWTYTGFADPDRAPWDWQVTVVNNRGDRIPRSRVFARLLVEEAAAHRHVLIGSNVDGLLSYIDEALTARLGQTDLTDEAQVAALFDHLKIEDPAALSRALGERLGLPSDAVQAWIAAAEGPAIPSWEKAKAAAEGCRAAARSLAAQAGEPELEEHLVGAVARHRAASSWRAASPSQRAALFADLFRASLIPLRDPASTGDQVQQAAVRAVPPGARARIMSLQNIKGTGLDFIYRWMALREVQGDLAMLRAPAEAEGALTRLSQQKWTSQLNCAHALRVLAEVEVAPELEPRHEALRRQIEGRIQALRAAASSRQGKRTSPLRRLLERLLDPFDAVLRRRAADRTFRALIAGRIGHTEAQDALQALTARQKGGWL